MLLLNLWFASRTPTGSLPHRGVLYNIFPNLPGSLRNVAFVTGLAFQAAYYMTFKLLTNFGLRGPIRTDGFPLPRRGVWPG